LVIRSPLVRKLTFRHPELRKGKVPVIIRANRSLIRLVPSTKSLIEMDPPQDNAGDDPKAMYLGSFGPTYATIPVEGDGMDGKEPLPPPEVKARGNSKAAKTPANERTRKSSKEASHKRQKTKGEKRGKKKEKK
jgi:hypothetical protein